MHPRPHIHTNDTSDNLHSNHEKGTKQTPKNIILVVYIYNIIFLHLKRAVEKAFEA